MSKNYASLYNSSNDSMAIVQRMYIKKEITRGTLVAPVGADFIYTQAASLTFGQAFAASTQKSDRAISSIIKEKKTCEFSIPLLVNIDTSVAAGATEIDSALQVLMESLLGQKTVSSGLIFDQKAAPSITFSIYNCGDVWAEQCRGAFVQSAEISLDGAGQSQITFTGNAKDRFLVGIGKSIIANTANTITLQTGEAKRFPVGSKVMIIESNGTTRSADTPDGTPRTVTASDTLTDIITVDGAVLADADGSVTPIYVCYYEPTTPVAIDNPQTGLQGSVAIDNYPSTSCVRSATISINNNHELADYCYGSDSLNGALFIPGSRLEVMVSMEMNLNATMVEFLQRIQNFEANQIAIVLGNVASRHMKIELPKVMFPVPAINVPESGSIPVSFSDGIAMQTAEGALDGIEIKFL